MSEAFVSCFRRATSKTLWALVDGFLPLLALLTLSGLFLRAFALAALLLLLEIERGLPISRLVLCLLRMLLRVSPTCAVGG